MALFRLALAATSPVAGRPRASGRIASLVAAGLVLAGCHCGCPARGAQAAPRDGYRAASAPPPPSERTPEEDWYFKNYGQVPAVDVQFGKAVYYGKALAGNPTASGEVFDPARFTAAHRSLPFGTVLRVVRLDTGEHTYVKVNDRGPFGDDRRIIDLAEIAASRIDMLRDGVVDVRIEVLRWGDDQRGRHARR